jgi:hypothetical protein
MADFVVKRGHKLLVFSNEGPEMVEAAWPSAISMEIDAHLSDVLRHAIVLSNHSGSTWKN